MVHAFVLVFILGGAEQRGQPMYFRDINQCNYFASRIVKRYGNYHFSAQVPQEHKATAYCKPSYIKDNTETLYD